VKAHIIGVNNFDDFSAHDTTKLCRKLAMVLTEVETNAVQPAMLELAVSTSVALRILGLMHVYRQVASEVRRSVALERAQATSQLHPLTTGSNLGQLQ